MGMTAANIHDLLLGISVLHNRPSSYGYIVFAHLQWRSGIAHHSDSFLPFLASLFIFLISVLM
jgi:hypothetical protein